MDTKLVSSKKSCKNKMFTRPTIHDQFINNSQELRTEGETTMQKNIEDKEESGNNEFVECISLCGGKHNELCMKNYKQLTTQDKQSVEGMINFLFCVQ